MLDVTQPQPREAGGSGRGIRRGPDVPSSKRTHGQVRGCTQLSRELGFQVNEPKIVTQTRFSRISPSCLHAKNQTAPRGQTCSRRGQRDSGGVAAGVARANSRGACRWPRGGPAGGGEAAPTWQGHHSVWLTWASPGSSTRAPGQWPDGRATSKTVWWPKQQRHLETTPLSGFLAAQPSSRPRRNQKATGRRSCPGGLPASGAGLSVAAGVTGGWGRAVPAAQAHPAGVRESTGHPLPGQQGHGPKGEAGHPVLQPEGWLPAVRATLS